MQALKYDVDPVLRRKLIYIALNKGFVPEAASEERIESLYQEALASFNQFTLIRGNDPIDMSWVDSNAIVLSEEEIGRGLRETYQRAYPGKLSDGSRQEINDSDKSLDRLVPLQVLVSVGMRVYNRQTLLRLLIAFGYLNFSGNIASATRLADWELRFFREYPEGFSKGKIDLYKFKAYVSSLSRDSLKSLLISKSKLPIYFNYPLSTTGPVDLLINRVIYGNGPGTSNDAYLTSLGTGNPSEDFSVYVDLSEDVMREKYPDPDDLREVLGKVERYRQAISMGVTALKMGNRAFRGNYADETVYANIANDDEVYQASMQVEYIMQGFPNSDQLDILAYNGFDDIVYPDFDSSLEVISRGDFVSNLRAMSEKVPSEVIRAIYREMHAEYSEEREI